MSRPQPGWSEQNPEDWWKACNIVVKTLGKMKPKAVAAVEGIGLSGQQHGATLLGKDDKVLRPAILWNDARSFRECEDIMNREPKAVPLAGNIPLAGYTAPKLVWVKKHEPKTFAKVAKVLLPKDYIRLRMTGEYASDMSDASGTFWLDIAKRRWSDMLLAASDMSIDQMPKLYEGTDARAVSRPRSPGLGHAEAAGGCGRRRRQCIRGLRHRCRDGQFGAGLDRHLGRDVRVERQVPPQCRPHGACLLPCRARYLAPDGRDPLRRSEPRMAGGHIWVRLRRS